MYPVLVNGIRKIYPNGLNKGFTLKFHADSWVWQETPEEGERPHWLKCCEYNNKDEDNSLNTRNDKNHQTSSQKFREIIFYSLKIRKNNFWKLLECKQSIFDLWFWSSYFELFGCFHTPVCVLNSLSVCVCVFNFMLNEYILPLGIRGNFSYEINSSILILFLSIQMVLHTNYAWYKPCLLTQPNTF